MKFTKEDAYKELVERIPNKGQTLNLSERSINTQLDTLMPLLQSEETELADFIEKVLPIFKTADGNLKNDVSVGIKSYIDSQKKDDKDKDGSNKKDANNDSNSQLADALRRISELEKENQDAKSRENIKNIRNSFIAKVKEKGVKNSEWLEDYLSEITITEDFDIDARAESCLKFYNKSSAKVKSNISPKGAGGEGDDYSNDIQKAIKAAADLAKQQRLI